MAKLTRGKKKEFWFLYLAVPCPVPVAPANGNVFGENHQHRAVIQYWCKQGFVLHGAISNECVDGKWNTSIPSCKGNQCNYLKLFKSTDVVHCCLLVDYPSHGLDILSCIAKQITSSACGLVNPVMLSHQVESFWEQWLFDACPDQPASVLRRLTRGTTVWIFNSCSVQFLG